MNCRHWHEQDGYEICYATGKKCACSAQYTQCGYPEYFNVSPFRAKQLRRKDSINRSVAAIEPYIIGKDN